MGWVEIWLVTLLSTPPADPPPLQRPRQREPAPAASPAPAPAPAAVPSPPPEPDAPRLQRPGQPRAAPSSRPPRPADPGAPIVQRPGQRRVDSPLDDPDGPLVPLPGQELTPFDYPDGPHVLPPSLAARDYGYATQEWESERAPSLTRERTRRSSERTDRTGFIWQLGVGYTSAFVFSYGLVPSAKIDGLIGGSLSRRHTVRGTRKSALGLLAEVELPVGLHRYHFAATGVAGPRNTFYWRVNTGFSFNRRAPAFGVGGNLGVGIDLGRDRLTELTLAISASIDGGVESAASVGLTASILRF